MKRMQLGILLILAAAGFGFPSPGSVNVTTTTPAAPAAEGMAAPLHSEFFLLSFPLAAKKGGYNSIVDHNPPFYNYTSDPYVVSYTGETTVDNDFGNSYWGPGVGHCGQLGINNSRSLCYNGHTGLDYGVPEYTPVYAAHAGVVISAGPSNCGGSVQCTVDVRDETNPEFITLYTHVQPAGMAAVGQHVARGDQIALSGNTGKSTGPHLHFALYWDETWNSLPSDSVGHVLDPYGWFSQRIDLLGAPVNDDKWANGYPSQGTPNEPAYNWNRGGMITPQYVHKDGTSPGVRRVGASPGVDAIEQWWTTSSNGAYGSAGPPIHNAYWKSISGGYCQDFEGGTYCPDGYSTFFSDVPITHWAHRYIGWAYREGVISGYNDGTFRPSNFATRSQFSKMVVNGFSMPINTAGGPHFCDVPTSDPFYSFIETLYNSGAISGYSGGTCGYSTLNFLPGNQATRGQVAKVVEKAGEYRGLLTYGPNTTGGQDYSDVPSTDTYWSYIEILYNYGIIQYRQEIDGPGLGGHFYTYNYATRAQIAMFIHETIYAAH